MMRAGPAFMQTWETSFNRYTPKSNVTMLALVYEKRMQKSPIYVQNIILPFLPHEGNVLFQKDNTYLHGTHATQYAL